MSKGSLTVLATPANAKDGAFSEIVRYWLENGEERLACLELSSLGQALVQWVEDGDYATTSAVLGAVEEVMIEELPEDRSSILATIVRPCFLEGIDAELCEREEERGYSDELRRSVMALLGPTTRQDFLKYFT